jgi:hypothetical protein
MVLYGDSHAFNDIAIRAGWKFVLLSKPHCPVDMLPIANPRGFGPPGGEWIACDEWRRNSINRIDRIDPDLVVVSQLGTPRYSPK